MLIRFFLTTKVFKIKDRKIPIYSNYYFSNSLQLKSKPEVK